MAAKKGKRRYRIRGTKTSVEVETVQLRTGDGRPAGTSTRVTFDDGWRMTLMGAGDRAAVQTAAFFKSRGEPSEQNFTDPAAKALAKAADYFKDHEPSE